MLTLLFLIHRLFYSNPKTLSPSHPDYHIPRNNKGSTRSESNQFSCQNYKDPLLFLQRNTTCNCKQEISSRSALLVVCEVSATIVVAESQSQSTKPLNSLTMSAEEKFRAAVRVIHSLPKDGPYQPSNSTKLKFYGLYKQATEGKNNTPKPGFWDVIGRAKWEAWNKLGDISKDNAMDQYVDCLKEIVETMSFNGDVEDFLDSISPFYEFVTLQGSEMNHIKEKIEEFSSSNSSLANSLANSKENSPMKMLENGVNGDGQEEEEEEEISAASEKAEVTIETNSAIYETKKQPSQNGEAFKMTNGNHVTSSSVVPPPAPRHSYSHLNGSVKNVTLPSVNDEEDVLLVSTSYNAAPCKEDLEKEFDSGNNSNNTHPKIRMTSSVDTVTSVCSGTESEKYYSGDSEPEMDERFVTFIANNSECYPSSSAAALAQPIISSEKLIHLSSGNDKVKSIISSPMKDRKKVSPKNTSPMNLNSAVEVATQQTIERLNRDVDHILARLRILEAAYAANAEGAIRVPTQSQPSRRKRRIFGDLSPQTIAFVVMWPFAVQFLIKLIRWWWRRRRNTNVRAISS